MVNAAAALAGVAVVLSGAVPALAGAAVSRSGGADGTGLSSASLSARIISQFGGAPAAEERLRCSVMHVGHVIGPAGCWWWANICSTEARENVWPHMGSITGMFGPSCSNSSNVMEHVGPDGAAASAGQLYGSASDTTY